MRGLPLRTQTNRSTLQRVPRIPSPNPRRSPTLRALLASCGSRNSSDASGCVARASTRDCRPRIRSTTTRRFRARSPWALRCATVGPPLAGLSMRSRRGSRSAAPRARAPKSIPIHTLRPVSIHTVSIHRSDAARSSQSATQRGPGPQQISLSLSSAMRTGMTTAGYAQLAEATDRTRSRYEPFCPLQLPHAYSSG
jgi:hypothetical protein